MENEVNVPKWPLTGPHRVEVTRWWYEPTETQNGGQWVYELLVIPQGEPEESFFLRGRRCLVQTFEIRVQRQKEDGVTKRRKSVPSWVHGGFHKLPVKATPGEFAMLYREQHALALKIAQKAEERYLKAIGAWTPEEEG